MMTEIKCCEYLTSQIRLALRVPNPNFMYFWKTLSREFLEGKLISLEPGPCGGTAPGSSKVKLVPAWGKFLWWKHG